jgi:hypothetical protein
MEVQMAGEILLCMTAEKGAVMATHLACDDAEDTFVPHVAAILEVIRAENGALATDVFALLDHVPASRIMGSLAAEAAGWHATKVREGVGVCV